ncbi:uncharacterized protein BJ171DRAFT_520672 [Polychytrium aggregatum]|uniref:uncharacterized protein n=1 Tax=Polychytrium aggregatum TaxID=110093 RepID=UPI0022FEB49A|nr:uncharacterized protein BJ171DRAFT_520672 [Polychytrium aggregatum]KAI9197304.1 hypothetical protein BJ171DRAFT_520672 [Polychytrium aggregatum]
MSESFLPRNGQHRSRTSRVAAIQTRSMTRSSTRPSLPITPTSPVPAWRCMALADPHQETAHRDGHRTKNACISRPILSPTLMRDAAAHNPNAVPSPAIQPQREHMDDGARPIPSCPKYLSRVVVALFAKLCPDLPAPVPPSFLPFLNHVLVTTDIGTPVVVHALYYLTRLRTQIKYCCSSCFLGTWRDPMSLVLMLLVLSNKILDDHTFTNKTWCEVSHSGGHYIGVSEMNRLEMKILDTIQFRAVVAAEQYDSFELDLRSFVAKSTRANPCQRLPLPPSDMDWTPQHPIPPTRSSCSGHSQAQRSQPVDIQHRYRASDALCESIGNPHRSSPRTNTCSSSAPTACGYPSLRHDDLTLPLRSLPPTHAHRTRYGSDQTGVGAPKPLGRVDAAGTSKQSIGASCSNTRQRDQRYLPAHDRKDDHGLVYCHSLLAASTNQRSSARSKVL